MVKPSSEKGIYTKKVAVSTCFTTAFFDFASLNNWLFEAHLRRDRVMNLLPNILEIQFLINMSKP